MMTMPRFVDRQVPVKDEIFLDHVAYFVADLDMAGVQFQRLGFACSDVNLQTNLDDDGIARPSGTSNRLIRLRRGFLEILAATHATPLAAQLQAARSRYEGVHLLAFSHADLESQRMRLIANGFEMQSMAHVRRKEPGSAKQVAWSVLRPEAYVMREGRIQFAYPHTPELSWPPGSTEHANGAENLTGVILCVADMHEAIKRYELYLGREAKNRCIELDRGYIAFMTPAEQLEAGPQLEIPDVPYVCAVTISTKDLNQTRSALRLNGVTPLFDSSSILWIGPADAMGCYLGIHERLYVPF
ncbi:MAG: VOC family protein [Gammaproteobacteria bacterium]|nr:VOC family protein [Gammaproteobacteria bacterium]